MIAFDGVSKTYAGRWAVGPLPTLRPLVGAIPVQAMREANFSIDRDQDKLSPSQAAQNLAHSVGLQH